MLTVFQQKLVKLDPVGGGWGQISSFLLCVGLGSVEEKVVEKKGVSFCLLTKSKKKKKDMKCAHKSGSITEIIGG